MRVMIKVKNGGQYFVEGAFLEDVISKMALNCPLTNAAPYDKVDNNLRKAIYHSLRKHGKAKAKMWGNKEIKFFAEGE